MNDKLRLGWIGTGVMGHAMAGHLLASGYPLTVYNRTKSRAEGLLACGARWADTPQEVARNSDVVFSIVGYPRDVEEVMLGEQGALSGLAEGGILCDMTTSSPELARRIAEAAAAKGCISLDAPVTGGDIGAREARLSIFVGGDKEAFDEVKPILECMGNPVYTGKSGSGDVTKLVNNMIAGAMLTAIAEGYAFAAKAGIDLQTTFDATRCGFAGGPLYDNKVPMIIHRNYTPGARIAVHRKDIVNAKHYAHKLDIDTPMCDVTLQVMDWMKDNGHIDEDQAAMVKYYEDKMGVTVGSAD